MLNLILIIGFYLLVSGATPFYCPVKLRFCVRSNSCIVVRFRPIFAKALCDKIKYDRGIGTLTQTSMSEYLKYDLRLDITKPLNYELIEIIAKAYKSRNLKTLATLVKKGKI